VVTIQRVPSIPSETREDHVCTEVGLLASATLLKEQSRVERRGPSKADGA